MPRIALGLGNGRTALPGGARGCLPFSLPLTLGDRTVALPPHPRRRFLQAGWVGLQVSRGLVA